MEIKIIAFGQLAEIMGKEITLEAIDITALKQTLNNRFPALSYEKYAMAVNKKLVQGNLELNQNDIVALMPPYAGG
jgi:molybdopterin converting factor small subunit